jgi:hypothetical protein
MSPTASAGPTVVAANPTSKIIPRAGARTGADRAKGNPPAAWSDIEDLLRRGEATTWLSLRRAEGVHTRPVFAAWASASCVVASRPRP